MCTQIKGLSSKKSVRKNKQILDSVSVKYFLLQKNRYVQGLGVKKWNLKST